MNTAPSEAKRYLGIVQFRSDATMARIREDAPKVLDAITRLADGRHEIAFRSTDGLLFGVLFVSAAPGPVIRAAFTGSSGTLDGDAFLLIEVGPTFNGDGFSRAWTWLQHH